MTAQGDIPVEVRGLISTAAGFGVLLGHGEKVVIIFVDQAVGTAIGLALNKTRLPRPLTHDLFGDIFAGLDVSLLKVVVNDLREGTFYARLYLEQAHESGSSFVEVDARPSDSIALALRLQAPLFVRPSVWAEAEDMSWALREDPPDQDPSAPGADAGGPEEG